MSFAVGINELFDGLAGFSSGLQCRDCSKRCLEPEEVRKWKLKIQRKIIEEKRFFTRISRKPGDSKVNWRQQGMP